VNGYECLNPEEQLPCSENGRRKIIQNSIEVDAETKESTRKNKKKTGWKV
jgi:hypothetical protein